MGGHPESGSATVATRKRGGWVRVSVGECACVCPTLPGAARGCWGERPAERSPAALCSGGCYAAVCRRPGSCHRRLPALIPAQLEGRGHGQRSASPFSVQTRGFRRSLGGAGAVPAVRSRRGRPASRCLLPFMTMEIPPVAIAPGTCCEGLLGEILHFLRFALIPPTQRRVAI